MLRITEVRVSLRDDAKLKAFASITLEDCFVIRGLKVIEGNNSRMFVAMPSRKRPDGRHQDLAHPITKEMRQAIEDVIIRTYNEVKAEDGQRGARPPVLDESEIYSD
jgi:stage V sporulation protein G